MLKGCGYILEETRRTLRWGVCPILSWAPTSQGTLQAFYQEAVVRKRMVHRNIAPFCGVTLDPLQLISERMEAGDLMKWINERPEVNRVGLVSFFPATVL